jgi:arylsulfatase A-like enzyme
MIQNATRWLLLLASALLLTSVVSTVAGTASEGAFGAGGNRPNIILILTDDQRWDSLSFMPTVNTRLQGEGTTFTNAFATTPLCCPSRASILTGRYSFRHGVLTNGGELGGAARFNDLRTLATELQRQAGYDTHYMGRYLNGYYNLSPYIPPGWTDFATISSVDSNTTRAYYNYNLNDNGSIVNYGDQPSDYSTDVFTARALDVINSYDGVTPYFIHLSYVAPHAPRIPADRHVGAYGDVPPWLPPSYNESDISDKPAWLTELPDFDDDRARDVQVGSLESMLAVDDGVQQILDALEVTNQADNTLVIFTSDNGFSWGEHRIIGKSCPYEECLRVPLVVWYPPTTRGNTIDRQVLNIDLPATIATVAGVTQGLNAIDGVSLTNLLNPQFSWRTDFLLENWQNPGSESGLSAIIPDYKGVRNAAWKYVEYVTGEMELYDLVNDPYELQNVVADPANAAIVAQMQVRLDELRPFDPSATPAQQADYSNIAGCAVGDEAFCMLQYTTFE